MSDRFIPPSVSTTRGYFALSCALLLAACGAGQSGSPAATQSTTQLQLAVGGEPVAADAVVALPTFHVAPVLLEEPSDIDRLDPTGSARMLPHAQPVPAEFASLSSRRLTWQMLDDVHRNGPPADQGFADSSRPSPLGSGTAVATYTPAQIRSAYGLPALPSSAALSAAQAAQLGAGQTIYLVDAQADPNAAAELATFNQKFGLPACTSVSIPSTAALPLPAAPTSGCTFSVVYSTATGGMTATAPAYNSGWATEIALDVQWSHATAPYARIVLIEAPDASLASLTGAVALANAMGPGVVSMSFGSPEGSWTSSVDSYFTANGMTYLAATGDSGTGVQWPSVSAHVVAVGGTTLNYNGSSPRSEVAWADTGGGVSQYVATPSWQSAAVPGLGTLGHRGVADVAFNADPNSGQYVAVINPGSATAGWLSAGGTSLATPQWAAIIAIANAVRAQSSQAPLATPQAVLYGTIGGSAGLYAAEFLDVTQGSDGSCVSCAAHTGYDLPTGLGTPNVTSLLGTLTGATTPSPTPPVAAAPVVTSASVSGTVGTPLSYAVSVSAPHAVSYALSGAPAGVSVSAAGLVTWASPVLGNYTVNVTAHDAQTGLSGSGTLTIAIAAPAPPSVSSATVQGVSGTALTFTVSTTDTNAVTWSLSGAPSGMTVSSAGIVSWASPVAGTRTLTVKALDTKTGLTGQGVYTVVIAAAQAPVVNAASVTGHVGAALSFTVSASDANPLTYALSGAPSGMTISANGTVSWPSPVAGKYAVTVAATDSKTGLTGQGVYTVTISASGPVITANGFTGVAGKSLTGTVSFADSTSNSLSVTLAGVPSGFGLAVSGSSIVMTWANPVTGNYTITVTAKDGNGASATLLVPVTVTAH